MKKLFILIIMIALFSLSTTVFAASQEQIDEKIIEIKSEQAIYDTNVRLAGEYLDKIINGGLTLNEKAEYRIKLTEAREKFNVAADRMLELKKELYGLTHNQ